MAKTDRRPVLVTGAAGRVGCAFSHWAHERGGYALRLMVRGDEGDRIEAIRPLGEVVEADLTDLRRLREISAGIDTVIHLAANPSEAASWRELLDPNILGTYHVFAAAKSAGVRRVVFASSIHAVSGYPPGVQVRPDDPVNPGDLYGVTKCFGEALARYMAEQEGVSAIVLRIGGVSERTDLTDQDAAATFDYFVSTRDLCALIGRAIEVEGCRFALLHALSGRRFGRLSLEDTVATLGWEPQDDLAASHPALRAALRPEIVHRLNRQDPGMPSGLREDL